MKNFILFLAIAAAILATVSTVFAQSDYNDARATAKAPAATKNSEIKDTATDNVPGLVTPEQHKAIPYRACINARGWANGRLVCAD